MTVSMLIITKLEAYAVVENGFRLIQNYLSQRQQRVKVGLSKSESLEIIFGVPQASILVKVGLSKSESLEIIFGVPQASILGPVLFSVFISDLLLFMKARDICNFGRNNSICYWKRFRYHPQQARTRDKCSDLMASR